MWSSVSKGTKRIWRTARSTPSLCPGSVSFLPKAHQSNLFLMKTARNIPLMYISKCICVYVYTLYR